MGKRGTKIVRPNGPQAEHPNVKFRGRELQHVKLGNDLMDKIKVDMENIGKIELQPKFDGKQMIMVVQPV